MIVIITIFFATAAAAAAALNGGAVGDEPQTCPSQSVLEMLPAVPPVSRSGGGTVPPSSSRPHPPISGVPSPESSSCGGKGSLPTCVLPSQRSCAPAEAGSQNAIAGRTVNEGGTVSFR